MQKKVTNMNDEVNKTITAIGSLAELCWIFFSGLLKQGFTKKQALELTITFMNNTME